MNKELLEKKYTLPPLAYFIICVMLWIIIYWVFKIVSPRIKIENPNSLIISIYGVVAAFSLIFTSITVIEASIGIRIQPVFLYIGIGCAVVINHFSHIVLKEYAFFAFLISDLSIIIGSVFIGKLISDKVNEISWIIPITVIPMFTDIWSVYYGVSAKIVQRKETIVHLITHYPVPGRSVPVPLLGMADFIFLTIFLALAHKFKFSMIKNIFSLITTLVFVFILTAILKSPLPVLPFIGVTFILVNLKKLKMNKRDLITTIIFVLFIMTILCGISIYDRYFA